MRAVLTLLLALGLVAAAPATAPADLRMPLSHAGRWITDATGRVVVLHGHNMVYKRPPYTPEAVGFGDDDAAFLAAEGVNTVRVGIVYAAVEPQPGVYDDAYLASINRTVDALARHGIVSMLDFHQDLFNERFQGEGWPDWAVQDDGLPAQPQAGFPGNYLVMPALWRAFDHFWANDPGPGGVGLQDRYAAAWAHVAARFRDHPAVMGYDLLNEPWPGTGWQLCANPVGCPEFDARLAVFVARTLSAIRLADDWNTLVFYEPHVLFNNGVPTHLPDFGDEHLGMSFHDYCLSAETGTPQEAGCEQFDDLVFDNADARAEATGDALLLTEFGATDAEDVLVPMLDRADRHMVGWQHWHYCPCDDPTTTGAGPKQAIVLDPAKPPAGDNVKPEKLKLLGRPYPQAIAGTPLGWSWDAEASRLEASWSTEPVTGRLRTDVTEIATPPRQYPAGYAASARGGRVVSKPNAPVLLVQTCPGAREVAVTVAPQGERAQGCAADVRLSVTVAPRAVPAGRRVRLRVRVRAAGRAVAGAAVRAGGRRARTSRTGRATLRVRFRRPGRRAVRAALPGARPGVAWVRVRRAG